MKCLIVLLESNTDLILNIELITQGVFQLINNVNEIDSKIIILNFVENLIRKMKSNELKYHFTKLINFLSAYEPFYAKNL